MKLDILCMDIIQGVCNVLTRDEELNDFLSEMGQCGCTDTQIENIEDVINLSVLNGIEYCPIAKDLERVVYPEDKQLPKDEQVIARIQLREGKYSVWMHQGSRSNEPKLFDMTEYHKALEYFYDMIQKERYMHFFAKGVMV